MKGCNLLARTLVISFTEEFRREIGLKSLTLMGPSILGIKVMKEPLILCKQTFPSQKAAHSL
jgi:hypothetical protein